MRIRKEVIREGNYVHVDKAGRAQMLAATPALLKYWHDSGNAMRAANLPIPIPFEHDPSASPMTPADLLRNNAGEVLNYELGHVEEGGKKIPALFSYGEIKDTVAQQKIKDGTINWTSPWFTSFVDGSGKKWEGVIGHLALTSRPRITQQQPFQAALSLTPAHVSPERLPAIIPAEGFALSRAGLVSESQPGTFKPVYPVAFSLWTGARFAFPDEGEKKSEKKEKKSDEGDKGGEKGDEGGEGKKKGGNPFAKGGEDGEEGGEGGMKPKFDPQTGEPIKTPLVDPDGDISVWTMIAYLASMALGVDIGEDIDETNGPEKLLEIFRQAVQEKVASADAAKTASPTDTTPPPDVVPGKGSPNPVIQEQQPMYMSLEQANAIADPTMKQIALSLVQAQSDAANEKKRNEAIRNKLFNDAKALRQKRLEKVVRHMNAEQKAQLEALATGAQFSLSDDGVVTDAFGAFLSILEAQQNTLAAMLTRPSAQLSVEPQPEETTGAVSAERMKQVAEEYKRSANLIP